MTQRPGTGDIEINQEIRVGILASTLPERAGLQAILSAGRCILPVAQGSQIVEILDQVHEIDLLVVMASDEIYLASLIKSIDQEVALGCGILWITNNLEEDSQLIADPNHAWGLLSVEFTEDELIAAVRAISEGLVVLPPKIVRDIFQKRPKNLEEAMDKPYLAPREMQVLELLAQGLANKQIAERLRLRPNTVKYYIASIYQKIDVNNRAEAVTRAIHLGLISV